MRWCGCDWIVSVTPQSGENVRCVPADGSFGFLGMNAEKLGFVSRGLPDDIPANAAAFEQAARRGAEILGQVDCDE